jgi:CDP-diacylglycerol pyrophosphatase
VKILDGSNAVKAVCTVVFVMSALVLALVQVKADPEALWKIVNGECVPDEREHGNPEPCVEVNISKGVDMGFAILKDNHPLKPHAYLLIPTRRITGIESAKVLAPGAPNYFGDAWAARSYLISLLKIPLVWDMVGLAVNSAADRSQNQLHIHIDCVRQDIRDTLRNQEDILDDQWSELKLAAPDHPYMAMKLKADSLESFNPFQLLADGISGATEHMGLETLVVAGAVFKDGKHGFYLLSSRHGGGASAHGEDLLDPSCRVAGLTK